MRVRDLGGAGAILDRDNRCPAGGEADWPKDAADNPVVKSWVAMGILEIVKEKPAKKKKDDAA